MMVIIIVGLVMLVVGTIVTLYGTHVYMNKEEHLPCIKCNFNEFLEQFYVRPHWIIKPMFKNSFFHPSGNDYDGYIHADIIKFNNKCMILDLISFFRFKIWSKKQWRRMYVNCYFKELGSDFSEENF